MSPSTSMASNRPSRKSPANSVSASTSSVSTGSSSCSRGGGWAGGPAASSVGAASAATAGAPVPPWADTELGAEVEPVVAVAAPPVAGAADELGAESEPGSAVATDPEAGAPVAPGAAAAVAPGTEAGWSDADGVTAGAGPRGVTRTRAGLPMTPNVEGTASSMTSTSTWSGRRPSSAAAAATADSTVLALASAWATRLALSGAAPRLAAAAGALPPAALSAALPWCLRLPALAARPGRPVGLLAVPGACRPVAVAAPFLAPRGLGPRLRGTAEQAQPTETPASAATLLLDQRGSRSRLGGGPARRRWGGAQQHVLLPDAPEVGGHPVDDQRQGHVDREHEEHQRHDAHEHLLLRVHLGALPAHQLALRDVGRERHGDGQQQDRQPGRREDLVGTRQGQPVLLQRHAEEGLVAEDVGLPGQHGGDDHLVEGEEERHLGEERPAAGHGVEAALLVERHHLLVQLLAVVLVLRLQLLDLGSERRHDPRGAHLLDGQRDQQDPNGDGQQDDREPVALAPQHRLGEVLEELQDLVQDVPEVVEKLDHEEPLWRGPALTISPYPLRRALARRVGGGT